MNNSKMKKQVFLILTLIGLVCLNSCAKKSTQFSLPQESESFAGEVYYNNKVDILFVVDNSKSMLQYQQRLASQVNQLITTLNALGMDYRVAVTTTTMSTNSTNYPMARKLVGSPLYLTQANINQLAERLVVGDSGSDLERGLDAMMYVTSSNYASVSGINFIRSDALLSVIFISDEIDQSSEFGNPNSNDYLNYLNNLKPQFAEGGRAWIANYIGILTNQSCDLLGGHVSIGTQFIRLVDASQGVKSSICQADLSSAVTNIKARIIDQLTSYRFKDVPNKSTIQVTVGGRAIFEDENNGWTLVTETQSNGELVYILKFHGDSIPGANEQVIVNYKASGAT